MSRYIQVTFEAHDPRALSSFWRDVLGYVHPGLPGVDLPEDADPLAAWDDFLARADVPQEQGNRRWAIEDPDGHGLRLFFQQVPEEKVAKNRVHLDVRAAPGLQGDERMAALEVECDRLVALGATRVHRFESAPPMSVGFIVMTGYGNAMYWSGPEAPIHALWTAITVPALVLRARREILPGFGFFVPVAEAERFAAAVPSARVVEIDANHHTITTHDDSIAAIGAFLRPS